MKQYDSYKDSGVEWIGKIPSHWEVCRLKNYCSLSGRIGWNGLRSEEFQQESYAYLVTGQDFIKADIDWESCYQIDKDRYDEDPFIQLKNGDLLITKDGTIGKIAKVSGLDKPACLNSGIFVMKQKKDVFAQNYLYWMLVSSLLKDYNSYTSSGTTILHLYQNVFEKMPMVVPSFNEQEAIANYLDKKCDEIDKAIATQEKRVELLKELRQNIITQAVTRGINPDAPLKDSGVEWIKEIPSHWKSVPIKYSVESPYNSFIDGDWIESNVIVSDGIRYLTTGNVGALKYKEQGSGFISESTFKELNCSEVFPGDILISRLNEPIGRACIVPDLGYRIVVAVDNVIYRPDTNLYDKQFLVYQMNCKPYADTANFIARGSTMSRVSRTTLGNFKLVIPPLDEQKKIVVYLNKKCDEIERSIEKAEHQIELLQELKQSIITEVVTGKRKVV